MEETLIHPPRSMMEVFKMLPEGTLAEIIDNHLYMSPSPTKKRQRISRNILHDRQVKKELYGKFGVKEYLDCRSLNKRNHWLYL